MTTINKMSVHKLEENCDVDVYSKGVNIILKLLENVIREPHNLKYRKIRLENQTIREKVLCLNGARELLENIGFEEVDGELSLSMTVLIARVKEYRDLLKERLDIVTRSCAGPSTSAVQIVSPEKPTTSGPRKRAQNRVPIKPIKERISFPKFITFPNNFLRHMEDMSDQVQQYEDESLQKYGRKFIPLERLTENALKNMRLVQKKIAAKPDKKEKDPCFRDWLLVELTRWFSEEFFTWVNTLPCKVCGVEKESPKRSFVDEGVRVEVSDCCNTITKFYRYNDVLHLLQSRKGRCGEYANCFTFLCRCLGYDARLVLATFDHVWTEVYSANQRKWIHVDPSDNVLDAPLIYEHGWKRVIEYVIGYSKDDIQDVTWRYSSHHDKIRQIRLESSNNVTELELLKTILILRRKRLTTSSEIRKLYLIKRNLLELVELMTPREPTEDEKKGRSSGDLSWRLQRGENEQSNNFYVFTMVPPETEVKQFNLRYSCSQNVYERFIENIDENTTTVLDRTPSWESCTSSWKNMYRKVERDWKMSYLCRAEGAESAEIVWKFDFSDVNLKVKDILLMFDTKLYENGNIEIQFITGGKAFRNLEDVKNKSEFSIRASLKGGKGDCAWQHAQLFRQNSNAMEYPFVLKIRFF